MAVWLVGGLLALSGALCYAELAAAHPRAGGDYVYLTRSSGRRLGFLFGWSQLVVVRPADIALLAFVFARYASELYDPFEGERDLRPYAAAAVVALTIVNILGVRQGTWTQNILTILKVLGLAVIVAAGVIAPAPSPVPAEPTALTWGGLQLALILVLFTYGGWNEMAYVAAEVREPQRNIARALVIGTVAVAALYLVVNGAFLYALGYAGTAGSEAVAVDAIAAAFPDAAGRAIAVLVCISALGAVNGLVFTGARITYAIGTEHAVFRTAGRWDDRRGIPVRALLVQGVLALAIVVVAGSFIDTILYTAPVVWAFFLATGISVFVLRRRETGTPRPYKVTGYPVTVIVFCAACLFMLYNCIAYAFNTRPVSLAVLGGVLLAGGLVYALAGRAGNPDAGKADPSGG
jgi:amino acid transporter